MISEILFVKADEAYDEGDLDAAYALFLESAEAGNAMAMTRLALMTENGEGTDPSLSKSVEWDLRAIKAGSGTSFLNLSISYKKMGEFEKAQNLLEVAFKDGDGEAAFELGKLLYSRSENIFLVRKYLDAALASGNLSAQSAEEIQTWIKSTSNDIPPV